MTDKMSVHSNAELLWTPSAERVEASNMNAFRKYVNRRFGLNLGDYSALYDWSVDNISDFWETLWDHSEIQASKKYDFVLDDPEKLPGAKWFEGARLNFAENLLCFRDGREAIVFRGESGKTKRLSYKELYSQVAKAAAGLKKLGLKAGDRVAGFMPNLPETVIAMLAVTSIGAIWSSASPDFGVRGVVDRFGQIEPRLLIACDGYFYGGKKFDSRQKIKQFLPELPSVEQVVIVPYAEDNPDISSISEGILWGDLLALDPQTEIEFEQLPADHPVYILYSSGTTGVPKCIVHGAIGTLLQHYKELALHTDITRDSTVFYFTTCGWMMWNWLVSTLMLGARVLLFDGSPFYPDPGYLWRIADEESISVFGTSARYLASLEKEGYQPILKHKLESLRVICSTGSPLSADSFRYVYRDIKKDVQLASISGGTDIISCFCLGDPTGPVYAGEIQCRGLGMMVFAYDEVGSPVFGETGELVCAAPAPSMPIYFWNDPEMKKYEDAYFHFYPGAWRHGDFITITENGGVVMLGRSDATLNPGGIRIGTAEIYRQVQGLEEVADSLVVGQQWKDDERVILFVKLADKKNLDEELSIRIKKAIRSGASPRHVPSKIIAVNDIPLTRTGKKVEMAVRKVINGQEVPNVQALANPQALEQFKNLKELQT